MSKRLESVSRRNRWRPLESIAPESFPFQELSRQCLRHALLVTTRCLRSYDVACHGSEQLRRRSPSVPTEVEEVHTQLWWEHLTRSRRMPATPDFSQEESDILILALPPLHLRPHRYLSIKEIEERLEVSGALWYGPGACGWVAAAMCIPKAELPLMSSGHLGLISARD